MSLAVHNLAVHGVVQLSDADVLERFVVREAELAALMTHLHEPDPPRHALVVGPRGMGKSLLLRRVAIAVAQDPALAARWLPLGMGEELYLVSSAGELWLAALGRLAEVLGDDRLADQRRALAAERDPARLAPLALGLLLETARQQGRQLVLLVENLQMLLGEQLAPEDGWALRQVLQTEPGLLLMASAVTTLGDDEVEDAEDPFYGFFHRIDLRPLDDAEVGTLWHALTGVEPAPARAVAVRILTGGNPRLITVLARFSRNPDLSGLRQDLELLIDEYTPYFKTNIEALPAVERRVLMTLADIWAPATSAEVAEQARLDVSKVSSLLGRLMRRGVVQTYDEDGGRRRYELTERLYNLYHLLRGPGDDGRVRALVDILVHLYEPGLLGRDIWPPIVRNESPLDLAIATRLHRHLDDAGAWDDLDAAAIEGSLATFQALLAQQQATLGENHPETLLTRQQVAYCVARHDPHEGLRLYRDVLRDQERVLGPEHRDTLASRYQVAYYTGETGDAVGALALYRRVAADRERVLGPDHRLTLLSRHQVAYYLGRTGDAAGALALFREVAADSARALGPDHRDTLISRHNLAHYLGRAGDAVGALALFRGVVTDMERALGPEHLATLNSRHWVAYRMGQTGDWVGALALFGEIAADMERAYGPDHRYTLTSRHQVAYSLGETGDGAGALALYREVAADCARALGPDDRDTLSSRHQVAYYTDRTGDAAGALALEEDVLRRAEATLPPEDKLLAAARWLRTKLSFEARNRPLPREYRDLGLTPRPPAPGPRRRRSGPRRGS